MNSPMLNAASRLILPLLLLYGLSLLLTGHSTPGGGFGGGLVVASALVLRSLVHNPRVEMHSLRLLRLFLAAGVLLIVAAAVGPMLAGGDLLENLSFGFSFPPEIYPDVSLLFETGVFVISAAGGLLVLEAILGHEEVEDDTDESGGGDR